MWSSRSNVLVSRLRSRGRHLLVPALGLALGSGGCTAGYVQDSTAPVLFRVTTVNDGAALNSDVRLAPSAVVDDLADVAVAVRSKNPNFENVPQVAMAVFVERYEISYYRSDGRGVQGVDVPYSISGNLTQVVDVATSGSVALSLVVVRAQAKLEPPLINLWGVEPGILGGQALTVSMFARISIHGQTTAGQAVVATGTLQINFADFPDEG